nr:RND transporter [Chitinophagaceae bacterium]
MWQKLAEWVLRYKIILLIALLAGTAFMAWQTRRIELSYEFSRAIPTDNPRYLDYLEFKNRFGEDGNVLVIGVRDTAFFQPKRFARYKQLLDSVRGVTGVVGIIGVPEAIKLLKNPETEKLEA